MEITTVYKGTKLYKIPAQPTEEHLSLIAPEGSKGVAILYEYPAASHMPDEMLSYLGKVIEGGMKLQPATVLTANLSHTDISLQKLSEQLKTKIVVVFGTHWLSELHNMHVSKNQIVILYGMKVLVTDTLDVIQSNDMAKKAFWAELKRIFS